MVAITLPWLASDWSWGWSWWILSPLNQTWLAYSYPNLTSNWYMACFPSIATATTSTLATYTRAITDFTIVETVWSTNINWYFRWGIADQFALNWNYFSAGADVWSATSHTIWRSAGAVNPALGSYNFTSVFRIASIESYLAWINIWSNCYYMPCHTLTIQRLDHYQVDRVVTTTAVIKIMNTAGTLTTIGTLTTTFPSKSMTTNWLQVTATLTNWIISWSFTPYTTSLGDRIIIDYTISANFTVVVLPSGGWPSNLLTYITTEFWTKWSNQSLTNASAFRPVQISLA